MGHRWGIRKGRRDLKLGITEGQLWRTKGHRWGIDGALFLFLILFLKIRGVRGEKMTGSAAHQ
jgi:hypothetical protein